MKQGDTFYVDDKMLRGKHFVVTRRVEDSAENITLECVDTSRNKFDIVVGDESSVMYDVDGHFSRTFSNDETVVC